MEPYLLGACAGAQTGCHAGDGTAGAGGCGRVRGRGQPLRHHVSGEAEEGMLVAGRRALLLPDMMTYVEGGVVHPDGAAAAGWGALSRWRSRGTASPGPLSRPA